MLIGMPNDVHPKTAVQLWAAYLTARKPFAILLLPACYQTSSLYFLHLLGGPDEIWKYYQSTIQVHANVLQNLSATSAQNALNPD